MDGIAIGCFRCVSVMKDLTVTLTTDRDENEVEFVEDPRERCALNVDSFVDEQEWKLHRYIHVWTKTREEAYKNTKNKHPCFSAATKASRRPEFFIWNILVVMVSHSIVVDYRRSARCRHIPRVHEAWCSYSLTAVCPFSAAFELGARD